MPVFTDDFKAAIDPRVWLFETLQSWVGRIVRAEMHTALGLPSGANWPARPVPRLEGIENALTTLTSAAKARGGEYTDALGALRESVDALRNGAPSASGDGPLPIWAATADAVVLFPDDRVVWHWRCGETPTQLMERHIDRLACDTHKTVTIWYSGAGDLAPNPLADKVFRLLEDAIPLGWQGPIGLTINRGSLPVRLCEQIAEVAKP